MSLRRILAVIVVVVLVGSAFTGSVSAGSKQQAKCNGETQTFVDQDAGKKIHVVYTVSFNQSSKIVCIDAVNKGELTTNGGYGIGVDDIRGPGDYWNLSPGESAHASHNLTGYFDVVDKNHTVAIRTYGGETWFHFTREWNTTEEGGFPTPYITNTSIIRNESAGTVFLNVTAVNPSKHYYTPSLVLKTFETDTTRGFPSKRSSGKLRYRFELEESVNETVAGQLKLYFDYRYPDAAFDQKEFVSKPDEETRVWDVQFGEVPSLKDMNEKNYYNNESARKFRNQRPDPISKPASIAGAVLTVALVVGGVWWRRRRKLR